MLLPPSLHMLRDPAPHTAGDNPLWLLPIQQRLKAALNGARGAGDGLHSLH